jgi:hypothetical protein
MSLQPYNGPRRTTPRRSSATQNHQAFPFGAPLRGLDVTQPLPGGDPQTAIRLENLIPRVLGCQMRRGYLRHKSHLSGEVRSLMKFLSPLGVNKLLAATAAGDIYDVTTPSASGVVPVPVLSVPTGTPIGEWTSLNFTTSAGVHVMLMVNPGSGYWIYDGATFTQITLGAGANQIAGINPNTFSFVTVYKNRVWFVEKDTTRAWYLPFGQYAGAATVFDFGSMLPNGGRLSVLINWTYDGSSGVGVQNQFIIIADQGDVLVYGGNDPAVAAEFQVVGRWYIGRVPVGARYFTNYQQDVTILSERGMVFMSELMRGQGFFQNPQIASNINSALAVEIAGSLDVRYWEVKFLPHEQLLLINRAEINIENLQWAYEVNNKAFAMLRGYPMLTVEAFNGKVFAGDLVGNIWQCFVGGTDGQVDAVPGTDLEGIVVTAFQAMGEAIRVKRFQMVRPSFISDSAPGIQAGLNSEWNLEIGGTAPAYLGAGSGAWDVGLWDFAVWSGVGQSYEAWTGAAGSGRYAALAMKVRASADTLFVGWQALVEPGGVL